MVQDYPISVDAAKQCHGGIILFFDTIRAYYKHRPSKLIECRFNLFFLFLYFFMRVVYRRVQPHCCRCVSNFIKCVLLCSVFRVTTMHNTLFSVEFILYCFPIVTPAVPLPINISADISLDTSSSACLCSLITLTH